MQRRRLRLRQIDGVADARNEDAISFCELPMGAYFAITGKGTMRLMFIKISRGGAQLDDWNNDSSQPDQYFSPQYPVYPLTDAAGNILCIR